MKKELLILFVAAGLWSCGDSAKEEKGDDNKETTEEHEGEHDHDHEHEQAPWPEAQAFHQFMADTWHPADEGDFEPIMAKARDMANAAAAWAASDIPEAYQKANVAEIIDQLSTESDALATMVEEGKSEEEILPALSALHDLFHEVIEKCGVGHHHHDHSGHDHDGHDHAH